MKCIILAAGKGSRLEELTLKKPKCLVLINKKPILFYIIKSLPETITEIFIVAGWRGKEIEKYIASEHPNKNIKIIYDNNPQGTFSSAKKTSPYLKENERFLLLHGDVIHQRKSIEKALEYENFIGHTKKIMPKKYLAIDIKNNVITRERKQTPEEEKTGVTTYSCLCVFNKNIFRLKPQKWCKEDDLIITAKSELPQNSINTLFEKDIIHVNTKRDLRKAQNYYIQNMPKK